MKAAKKYKRPSPEQYLTSESESASLYTSDEDPETPVRRRPSSSSKKKTSAGWRHADSAGSGASQARHPANVMPSAHSQPPPPQPGMPVRPSLPTAMPTAMPTPAPHLLADPNLPINKEQALAAQRYFQITGKTLDT